MLKRLLLAEPKTQVSRWIQQACSHIAVVITCQEFACARTEILVQPPDVLVTNLRLLDYNGLHLVLLANASRRPVLRIIHTDRPDPFLIREAQAHGAFFERTERIAFALPGYIAASLPERDRRNPDRYDRRAMFRGGRRAADQAVTV